MKNLFGTDGIRGAAGAFPLDEPTIRIIGASLARHFSAKLGRAALFVTGRDTRESGTWIEAAFHDGAGSEGASCESAGVITTPGVAYVTRAFDLDGGIVISASHNPYHDNGIKIFLPNGQKTGEDIESAIEADVYDAVEPAAATDKVNNARAADFRRAYLDHLGQSVRGLDAAGLKIVIDCANGAASSLAAELFRSVGAEVLAIHCGPNGRNINEACGSLHLDDLRGEVVAQKADLGVAFDGDADRALFVDEDGNVVDGDATLWILAKYLRSHGKLANSKVVATVMSNIGLEIALRSEGIELDRTSVGDKYVLDELLASGSEIGGEQSGHIILPEISLVGDGMMTALLILQAVTEGKTKLSAAVDGFVRYPQVLKNVKVREKQPFEHVPVIAAAAKEVEQNLAGSGRLLLRYSGTENLARVMIEGKDQRSIDGHADRLAEVIRTALG